MSAEELIDRQEAIEQAWAMGDRMRQFFQDPELGHNKKPDGSDVSQADTELEAMTTAFYAARGRVVVGEEGIGAASYGTPNAEYLDPIDGTTNFLEALPTGAPSLAAFSIGSAVAGQLVRGIVNFPLLPAPRLYWAEARQGVFRIMEKDGSETRLENGNISSDTGTILLSSPHEELGRRIREATFSVAVMKGTAFNACCVADPSLLEAYDPVLARTVPPVVGAVSLKSKAHDYAGASVLVGELGVTCGKDGGPLRLTAGKNGFVFAVNEAIRDTLLDILVEFDKRAPQV